MSAPDEEPRAHHLAFKYSFGDFLLRHPAKAAEMLLSQAASEQGRRIWDFIGSKLEPGQRLPAGGLTVEPFPGPLPVAVFTLPSAERSNEAVSIAAVWASDRHDRAIACLLERSGLSNPFVKPGELMLIALTPNGRINYGSHAPMKSDRFVDMARSIAAVGRLPT
jgi:hypothetical protein